MSDKLTIENEQPEDMQASGLPAPATIGDVYLGVILQQLQTLTSEMSLNRQSTDRLVDLLEQALRKPAK